MMVTIAQVGSTFLVPGLAAAGVAAVSIPIIIHLWTRARRKPEAFAAMRFLLAAFKRNQRRLQLEQWLLLLVRCLVVAILGLALAGLIGASLIQKVFPQLASARRVVVVVDNGLVSGLYEAEGTTLATHQAGAIELIEALGEGDRVSVWTTTQREALVLDSEDHAAAMDAVEALQPASWAGDVQATLARVGEASTEWEGVGSVWLFSAMRRGTDGLEDAEAALGPGMALRLMQPGEPAINRQVSAVELTRARLTPQGQTASAEATVRLRRFGSVLPNETVGLTVVLLDPATDEVLAEVQRDVAWGLNETDKALPMSLVVDAAALPGQAMLALRATLAGDALPSDDQRQALVRAQRQLAVGIVDPEAQGLSAGAWVRLALVPDEEESVEESSVAVWTLDPGATESWPWATLDAVVLARPDRLSGETWGALGRFVQEGGVLWVTVPSGETQRPWNEALRSATGVSWRIGSERVTPEEEGAVWSLVDEPAPSALGRLRADWSRLLQPVGVTQRVDVTGEEPGDVWMRVAAGTPWLLHRAVGEGDVLLLGSALDVAWTDLPTRPMFVALMQDALRALGGPAPGQVALRGGLAWPDGATGVVRVGDPEAAVLSEVPGPGVWRWNGVERNAVFVAGVDADAGDTRQWEAESVEQWAEQVVDRQAGWAWFDEPATGYATWRSSAQDNRATWTVPLLWTVLVLLVLETVLARRFSHAVDSERAGLRGRAAMAWRRLRVSGGKGGVV